MAQSPVTWLLGTKVTPVTAQPHTLHFPYLQPSTPFTTSHTPTLLSKGSNVVCLSDHLYACLAPNVTCLLYWLLKFLSNYLSNSLHYTPNLLICRYRYIYLDIIQFHVILKLLHIEKLHSLFFFISISFSSSFFCVIL